LRSKTVKRTSKALQTGRVRKERIGKSGADQMGSMGGYVSTLVVTVESKVEPEKVDEPNIVRLAQHGSKVLRPILALVDRGKRTARAIGLVVNLCGNGRKLGQQTDDILIDGLPVLRLVKTVLVCLGEHGVVVEGGDSNCNYVEVR